MVGIIHHQIILYMTKNNKRNDYITYVKWIRKKHGLIQNQRDREHFMRELALGIFDLAPIFSGLTSKEAVGLKSNQFTKEHYYPRKQSAQVITLLLDTRPNISDERIAAILKSRNRVHHVTREQNQNLRKYQKDKNKTWRQQYKAAGITLIKQK